MPDARTSQLPPRLLPVLYFTFAHASLALAFATVAVDPRGAAGFFYHGRMLALVHLVTLGWITSSILGSLYLVGPIALRVRFSARPADYVAFALAATGASGMVAHFWLQDYDGMAWSAGTAAIGIVAAGLRIVPQLATAVAPLAVKAHIALAFLNVFIAASLGILLGFDKVYHFLPGFVLANVFAHAHLAAIGWASMMVVGVAYRLLPMVLPAQMPMGPSLWTTAVLLETGVLALFTGLLTRSRFAWIGAVMVVAGFVAFLLRVVWMLRHPRPKPPAVHRPDPAVLHAGAAIVSLMITCALGLWLVFADLSETSLHVAMAYGVFGLLGFLAQLVVGMEGRLLPLFAWYWAFANTNYKGPVRSQHEMGWHRGQVLVFVAWAIGVPALACGFAFDAVPLLRVAAYMLLAATLLDTATVGLILRHAFVAEERVNC